MKEYRAEFVKKLILLREEAIRKGMKLLTVDEILAERDRNREDQG